MPTYSYECKKCAHVFDVFHAMSAKPRVKCAVCAAPGCKRLIGTGAGIIFKGSGFYETDFKTKQGTPPKAESGAKGGGKDSGDAAGAEKSSSSPETKPAKKEAKAAAGTASKD